MVAASVPCCNFHLISHAQIRWAPVLSQLVFICSPASFGYFSLPSVPWPSLNYLGLFFLSFSVLFSDEDLVAVRGGKGGRGHCRLCSSCVFSALIIKFNFIINCCDTEEIYLPSIRGDLVGDYFNLLLLRALIIQLAKSHNTISLYQSRG